MILANGTRVFHEPEYLAWNKAHLFAIFLPDQKYKESNVIIEIQYKRVSGADVPLATACSTNPEVLLGALDLFPQATESSAGLGPTGKGKGKAKATSAPSSPVAAASKEARLAKSDIYIVRVVAIPAPPGSYQNTFKGPRDEHRHYTLLAQGGWIAPPMEERLRHREHNAEKYAPYFSPAYKKPRVYPDAAAVAISDPIGAILPPTAFGDPAEIWMEVAEPTKEDVFWMAFQLVSGRVYKGHRLGGGFGQVRHELREEEREATLAMCPFSSPSPAAINHSANYRVE